MLPVRFELTIFRLRSGRLTNLAKEARDLFGLFARRSIYVSVTAYRGNLRVVCCDMDRCLCTAAHRVAVRRLRVEAR